MISDLIVTWPTNCDYPLWRYFIHKNRHRFGEVIVSISPIPSGDDYSDFIMEALARDNVLFIKNELGAAGDWRDNAVKKALLHSHDTEYVYFTEQDLYPRRGFWEAVKVLDGYDAFGVYQDERLHPCALFIKRDLLTSMPLDFSAKPPEYDHFGGIQKALRNEGVTVGKIPRFTYFHYNGLSHNWRLISENQPANYQPEIFYNWLRLSLECDVALDPRWEAVARIALKKYS